MAKGEERKPQELGGVGNHRMVLFGNPRNEDARTNQAGGRASQKRAVAVSAEVVPAYPVESVKDSTERVRVAVQMQAALRIRSVRHRRL